MVASNIGPYLYLYGGYCPRGLALCGDVWRYNTISGHWAWIAGSSTIGYYGAVLPAEQATDVCAHFTMHPFDFIIIDLICDDGTCIDCRIRMHNQVIVNMQLVHFVWAIFGFLGGC